MEIVDLEEKYAGNYFLCLEDWSEEINTFDREVFLDWGISDALFIDGKQIKTGPPPSYNKIYKKIAKKVKKLN